jgi:N utilization substance protein B
MSGFGGVGSRREARERALSLLYEAEAKTETPDQVLDALPLAPEEFAADLVAGVGHHHDEIDGLISRFARGWTIERMPTIDRTLLRIGTYELAHRPDVPTGAVISEAVELAKRYSTDDSGKFVNGLLARIAREVRPHEPAGAARAAVAPDDEPALPPPPRGLDLAIGAPPEGFEVELVPGDEGALDDGEGGDGLGGTGAA